jgi:type VI secretion system protein ImpI
MLTLRIENFDRLPDGGPLEFTIDKRGFDFGRDQHLDWTLPDRNKVVSGKHCEVRFYDGAYWLTDTSTNGTYLNGASKRMVSPYRLADGDRLAVGDYVLAVSIRLAQASPAPVQPASAPLVEGFGAPSASSDIWDSPHEAPPPIDASELMARSREADQAADFLHQAVYVPPPFEEPEPIRKPTPASPTPLPRAGLWGDDEGDLPLQVTEVDLPASVVTPPAAASRAAEAARPAGGRSAPTPSPSVGGDAGDFVRRFAAGAGLPESLFNGTDAGEVAEEAGRLLNVACLHIMAMLRARAAAKALSRSGNRTMISAEDNNPLKFMPTPEEALRVMLGPRTRGYLDGKAALESAFGDLKMHQVAFLASMQAALTELFDELSPDAVKGAADAKKSLLSGKGRYWDLYVERWLGRVGQREHGMLGAFLELYAEHYDKLSTSTRNRHG